MKSYEEKRNFAITREPKGSASSSGGDTLVFVVQKHAASHLHYDFRLEMHGALVSWAVPKGPSLNPKDKRLAAKVEDHPLEYGGFEGVIPQGEYGGGEVIVWDHGVYEAQKVSGTKATQEKELERELGEGKIEFVLHGEKLNGAWVLVHTRENQWLLMKRQDEFASDVDVLTEDQSVLSGHRIGGVLDMKHSPRPAEPEKKTKYEPMLLTEIEKPFNSSEWLFELKLDGIRAIATVSDGAVTIASRNNNGVTSRFPVLVNELKNLKVGSVVLDGEIVQFDPDGHPDFQALMQPFQSGQVTDATYCIFDVLSLDGRSLVHETLKERKEILASVDLGSPNLKRLDTFPEDGELLFDQALKMGFEGVVGKKLDSTYQSGRRSRDWVKVKRYHSEEFVVVGFTKGQNARADTFGALALAQSGPEGLVYQGNVGGGFSQDQLNAISAQLNNFKTSKSPFTKEVRVKDVSWVKPQLMVEVRFMTRTKDGRLRFPIFLRQRLDVPQKSSPSVSLPQGDTMDLGLLASEQLTTAPEETHLEIGGSKIHFSHLDKELWPGVTKRALANYYAVTSESLLKYLKNRPLSFVRCPNGVNGERFFQKHWDKGRPEFVETVSVFSSSNEGARDFVMCNNLETLLWLAQMGAVELNPWNSQITDLDGKRGTSFGKNLEALEESLLNRPDYLVLDLDPYFGGKAMGWKRADWERLTEIAFVLKDLLQKIGLSCFPKSSGKSGLHVYVPVARDYTYEQIRAAATTLGEQAIQRVGKKVTLEWNIKKRPEGVFIDVNQNVRGKTMAAPYSPRAASNPGVSMPLLWDELERVDPTQFTVLTAPARLAEKGDLWMATVDLHQKLFNVAP